MILRPVKQTPHPHTHCTTRQHTKAHDIALSLARARKETMVLSRRSWATLAAAIASSRAVYGNYEAGTVMSVTPEAAVFDTRSTLPYGCPPDGCVAANTRVSA